MKSMIQNILQKSNLDARDIRLLLSVTEAEDIEQIRSNAYSIMLEKTGESVWLRGLIEFSNICINDCYYCGIRKSNRGIDRYTLSREEIIDSAKWSADKGYGSVVLQSGERNDAKFIGDLIEIVSEIKSETTSANLPNGLGITLCVGEQSYSDYKRLFDAGAHRYLLRIETSNPQLYAKIHSPNQSFEKRIECLKSLKDIGYQLGTGVMIGIPGQSLDDLANDIMFFKEIDADMIGMGPFIVHSETEFANLKPLYEKRKREIYIQSLLMIAVARLYLKDVNIAATTALQALYPMGRETGLTFGANVIMPLLTPTEYRESYQLYNGKPCIDEFSSDCFDCIQRRVESVGRKIALDQWGDSLHHTLNNKK